MFLSKLLSFALTFQFLFSGLVFAQGTQPESAIQEDITSQKLLSQIVTGMSDAIYTPKLSVKERYSHLNKSVEAYSEALNKKITLRAELPKMLLDTARVIPLISAMKFESPSELKYENMIFDNNGSTISSLLQATSSIPFNDAQFKQILSGKQLSLGTIVSSKNQLGKYAQFIKIKEEPRYLLSKDEVSLLVGTSDKMAKIKHSVSLMDKSLTAQEKKDLEMVYKSLVGGQSSLSKSDFVILNKAIAVQLASIKALPSYPKLRSGFDLFKNKKPSLASVLQIKGDDKPVVLFLSSEKKDLLKKSIDKYNFASELLVSEIVSKVFSATKINWGIDVGGKHKLAREEVLSSLNNCESDHVCSNNAMKNFESYVSEYAQRYCSDCSSELKSEVIRRASQDFMTYLEEGGKSLKARTYAQLTQDVNETIAILNAVERKFFDGFVSPYANMEELNDYVRLHAGKGWKGVHSKEETSAVYLKSLETVVPYQTLFGFIYNADAQVAAALTGRKITSHPIESLSKLRTVSYDEKKQLVYSDLPAVEGGRTIGVLADERATMAGIASSLNDIQASAQSAVSRYAQLKSAEKYLSLSYFSEINKASNSAVSSSYKYAPNLFFNSLPFAPAQTIVESLGIVVKATNSAKKTALQSAKKAGLLHDVLNNGSVTALMWMLPFAGRGLSYAFLGLAGASTAHSFHSGAVSSAAYHAEAGRFLSGSVDPAQALSAMSGYKYASQKAYTAGALSAGALLGFAVLSRFIKVSPAKEKSPTIGRDDVAMKFNPKVNNNLMGGKKTPMQGYDDPSLIPSEGGLTVGSGGSFQGPKGGGSSAGVVTTSGSKVTNIGSNSPLTGNGTSGNFRNSFLTSSGKKPSTLTLEQPKVITNNPTSSPMGSTSVPRLVGGKGVTIKGGGVSSNNTGIGNRGAQGLNASPNANINGVPSQPNILGVPAGTIIGTSGTFAEQMQKQSAANKAYQKRYMELMQKYVNISSDLEMQSAIHQCAQGNARICADLENMAFNKKMAAINQAMSEGGYDGRAWIVGHPDVYTPVASFVRGNSHDSIRAMTDRILAAAVSCHVPVNSNAGVVEP
ncbi:MAG: hypothetical protein KBC84_08700 [Proteobacteria bacterium]|nr:hypothetical protein [Pseudomonadota bacterium]